jgi:hypothetical protein
MSYKPGDQVDIYHDREKKNLEGRAQLIEKVSEDDEREMWLVEFPPSHERNVRWLRKVGGRPYVQPGPTEEELYSRVARSPEEMRRRYPHHEHHSNGEASSMLALICTMYDRFIEEEENGIAEYDDLMARMSEAALSMPEGEAKQKLQKAIARIYRIREEERMHVDTLNMVKTTLCPSS